MPENLAHTQSLQAYPNIRKAAEILGVSASTLSRREDLRAERRGERDVVLAPCEVLRLGTIYRKRSLNDVAYDLIAHAQSSGPEQAARIEAEIEAYFEGGGSITDQREQLRVLARRLLPAALCDQIESVLDQKETGEFPTDVKGWPLLPED